MSADMSPEMRSLAIQLATARYVTHVHLFPAVSSASPHTSIQTHDAVGTGAGNPFHPFALAADAVVTDVHGHGVCHTIIIIHGRYPLLLWLHLEELVYIAMSCMEKREGELGS